MTPLAEREHAVITTRLAALRLEDEKEVWSHLSFWNKSGRVAEISRQPLPQSLRPFCDKAPSLVYLKQAPHNAHAHTQTCSAVASRIHWRYIVFSRTAESSCKT